VLWQLLTGQEQAGYFGLIKAYRGNPKLFLTCLKGNAGIIVVFLAS
jgi:hypothetical protein